MEKKGGSNPEVELYCPTCRKFVEDFTVSILGDTSGFKSGLKGRGGLPFKQCRECGDELLELTRM